MRAIIQETVTNASTFNFSLLTWITTIYQALEVQIGAGFGQDNWKFICHAVCAIFEQLYLIRRGNERCDPAGQVWHCLKCYKLQKELVAINFSHHNIVQKVLHQHLKTIVVLKSMYDRDLTVLNKKIDNLSKTVQKMGSKIKR